jgi:hypothetical protein
MPGPEKEEITSLFLFELEHVETLSQDMLEE